MSLFMTTHAGKDCVNTYNRDLCFMLKLSFHLKVWEFLKLIITAVSSLLWCKSLSPRKSSGTWADTMSLCQVCWEFTAWKAQVQVSPKPSTPLKQPVAVLGACTSTGIDRHGCLAIPITDLNGSQKALPFWLPVLAHLSVCPAPLAGATTLPRIKARLGRWGCDLSQGHTVPELQGVHSPCSSTHCSLSNSHGPQAGARRAVNKRERRSKQKQRIGKMMTRWESCKNQFSEILGREIKNKS